MTTEKLLFLGPENSPLLAWLREEGEDVFQTEEKITEHLLRAEAPTFLISYGYRHILSKEILDGFPNKAINLHISYLPWNRGADPNLWSFVEGTPKGVTIHYLDEGVDTGDIIAQQELEFDLENETLATSYEKLQWAIQSLFKNNWPNIKRGACQRTKQVGEGTLHKAKDKKHLVQKLSQGWDTPVSELRRRED